MSTIPNPAASALPGASAAIPVPFALQGWIDKNLPASLGAIGNREVFKGSDFIYQIIKGPNARNDFHIDPFDEIFHQMQGHIFVHVIEDGREKRIRIDEGQLFILPKNIYHSPRRPPGSLGLVIERPRKQTELDGIAWFCAHCSKKLHQVDFWCDDIERGLRDIIGAFNKDEVLRTCKECGTVLPDPTTIQNWDPAKIHEWG
ncbi:MAG: 3-hydroxyanthranilate 3,4-dioxygenase [Betaproteobacteria bacterium]|nr:3-hydroxyanthranilate 3,4-dioxygenase [Betaproteobacteria bacterium]